MDLIIEIAEQLTSLSSFIALPALMFILSLLIGMKPGKALTGAINISIGLIGMTVLFSFFNEVCTPVVNNLMIMAGKQTPVIDTGWPILSLFIWSNNISYLVILIAIVVNIIMLATKSTNTFNIDIWNMWHLAVSSVIVYETTGSILAVILVDVLITIIALKLADWSYPIMMDVYKDRGNVANSHINSLSMFPFAIIGNSIFDKISKTSKKPLKSKSGRFKKLSNPLVISMVIGLGMGFGSRLGVMESLEFALKISTVFLILPKIVPFTQIGFSGMAEGMEIFVKKHLKDKIEIRIGVNHMVFTDEDSVIVSSVILMPIAIIGAMSLSFINIFPLADLSNIVGLIVVINAVSRGNVFRNVIIGTPAVLLSLFTASIMAPLYKNIADKISFDAGVGNALWNSSLNGNNYISIWVANLLEGKMYAFIAIPFAALFIFICWKYFKKHIKENNYINTEELNTK